MTLQETNWTTAQNIILTNNNNNKKTMGKNLNVQKRLFQIKENSLLFTELNIK